MSSRFGFSELELPELPEPFGKDQIKAIEGGDRSVDIAGVLTSYNERLDQFRVATQAAGKFTGFKVPTPPAMNSTAVPNIDGVLWFRLDLVANSRGFSLNYTQMHRNLTIPNDRSELEKLLKRGERANFQGREPTGDIERPRYDGETSLSIDGDQKEGLLVVLNLSRKSGLQFNRDGSAISCRQEDLGAFLETGVLSTRTAQKKLENFDSVDALICDPKTDDCTLPKWKKNDKCRTAYFIVDASDLKPGNTFETIPRPFNIHVDIKGGKRNQGEEFFIPIIIDPDVRHPGGFGGGLT